MPKIARELGALAVKQIKHPEGSTGSVLHAVGGVAGLYLQTTARGGRSWILKVAVGGTRRELGLGSLTEDNGLKAARDKARETMKKINQGIDPVEERKAIIAKAESDRIAAETEVRRKLTFTQAVERYSEAKLGALRGDMDRKRWRSAMYTYAETVIGSMPVQDIDHRDILQVLEPIWRSKTDSAKRLRSRIEAVLSWATVAGYRSGENPARWAGNLSELLPSPSKVALVINHPAITLDDASRWFTALRLREGMGSRALEFLALTAARSGEVRGATWDEIDLKAKLWTIPATRMKMSREHRVPLSAAALELLQALPRYVDNELVFPSVRGNLLSDMTLSATMRRMHADDAVGFIDRANKRPAVPHGLRSTFRVWTSQLGYDRDMAELALAHVIGSSVERAYQRSDMLERRRAMMESWAGFLSGQAEADNVVRLG